MAQVSAWNLGEGGRRCGSGSPISLKSCQVSRQALDRVRLALAARLSSVNGRGVAGGPGSVIEWHEQGEQIIVRRSHRYTSEDVHRAVFAESVPKRRTLDELKAGIGRRMRERVVIVVVWLKVSPVARLRHGPPQ